MGDEKITTVSDDGLDTLKDQTRDGSEVDNWLEREIESHKSPYDPNLVAEVRGVTDRVHDMLNGPDGLGQIEGTHETQTVTLTLPKAFVYLASYLATRETEKSGEPSASWGQIDSGESVFDEEKTNRILSHILHNHMHEHLHALCHEMHWVFEEKTDDIADDANRDLDDEIPF